MLQESSSINARGSARKCGVTPPFDVISGRCGVNNKDIDNLYARNLYCTLFLSSLLSLHCSAAFITAFKDTTVLDRSIQLYSAS